MYACHRSSMVEYDDEVLQVGNVIDFIGLVKGFNDPMDAWYMDVSGLSCWMFTM